MNKKIEARWVDNSHLMLELQHIKRLLTEKLAPEEPLDIEGIANYLKLAKSTCYKKICSGEIPTHKVGGKNYCYPSELNDYIKGRTGLV